MAAELVEIDLGDGGGVHSFRSYEQLDAWLAQERERWTWIQGGDFRDPANLRGFVIPRIDWVRSTLENHRQQGQGLAFNRDFLISAYREHEKLLHSEGEQGSRVLDILEAHGTTPAAWAYGLASRRVSFGHASDPDELRGMIMMAVPGMIEPDGVARRLGSERRNLRERAERLVERLEEAEREREENFAADRRRGRRIAVQWARRRLGTWRRQFDRAVEEGAQIPNAYSEQARATEEEFRSTKASYEEAMRLKAPVHYWTTKAAQHKAAEKDARERVVLYFPVVATVLTVIFGASAWYLLTYTDKDSPTALFLIVSGGLATVAGLAFWAGRLLTRLYLSEHHLRNDAEERAVMTTTYLALTKDKAAEEVDRQIILAALFRNTPDGIVKDDSPMDLSIPMLLAKIGGPGKA